jgi:hypothetical protein
MMPTRSDWVGRVWSVCLRVRQLVSSIYCCLEIVVLGRFFLHTKELVFDDALII